MNKEDLQKIKKEMDVAISKKVEEKKKPYFGDKQVRLKCQITDFFITTINTQVAEDENRRGW